MSKPEGSFIKGVHGYLSCYSMKNHNEYVGGVADCWYSGTKRDLWIEYKFVVVPVRDTTLVVPDLTKLQLTWLTDRYHEGRNIWVVIGCKAGGVILTQPKAWAGGLTAAKFRESTIARRALATAIDRFVNQ